MAFPSRKLYLSLLIGLPVFFAGLRSIPAAEDTYTLEESAEPGVFQVHAELAVEGKLKTAAKDKTVDLDLAAEATFDYRERRLSGAGRDAASLRSLRQYDKAEASITVNRNRTFSELAKAHQVIVAQGRREGIVFYQPNSPLSRNELELLQMPGDPLAALGLLPETKVEVGQKWTPENWAVQMLTGTEALLKKQRRLRIGIGQKRPGPRADHRQDRRSRPRRDHRDRPVGALCVRCEARLSSHRGT